MWGKSKGLPVPYPLICHLSDVAAVAGALWDILLDERGQERIAHRLQVSRSSCRALVCFWAGLHDIGKISPLFQEKDPARYALLAQDPSYRIEKDLSHERLGHDAATHWALTTILAELGYPKGRPITRSPAHQVAQLLGGHHGFFHQALDRKMLAAVDQWVPALGGPGWEEQRHLHVTALEKLTGVEAVPLTRLPADLVGFVAGLTVVADWLASQEHVVRQALPPAGWAATESALSEHWTRAVKRAPAIVKQARLGRATFPNRSFAEQFPQIHTPNQLQKDLAEQLPALVQGGAGLLMITAPTGDGKTEAALHAASVLARASGAGGLFFALPTMATADAMHRRVRNFVGANVTGDTALTLVHSMSWLAAAPNTDQNHSASDDVLTDEAVTRIEAGRWLRTSRRGLLAPMATGTIDQGLASVLPVRFNMLRLFGLANKVLVVDEAHAYGPWMHSLLVRLLEWLGAMGAPVVLLSATLAGRTASSLVEAYRRGVGFFEPQEIAPTYPGWVYVDATTGQVTPPRKAPSSRPRRLGVEVHQVRWDVTEPDRISPEAGTRRDALVRLLAPALQAKGCVLVCCTTVEEAQRTYRFLSAAFTELIADDNLRLLHSRYPAWRRKDITDDIEILFGKPGRNDPPGRRPAPAVLVATSVVEQSLDLDFDYVISDAAALAQLLQRAGRCMRHAREDRALGMGDNPRIAVLEPVDTDGKLAVPRTWGKVHDTSLLLRTSRILADKAEHGISIPEDVQELIDAVYAEDFVTRLEAPDERQELNVHDAERHATDLAERHLADMTMIPPPYDLGDLAELSNQGTHQVDEELITTRLGADSERAVCAYTQPDGSLTLDPQGVIALPGVHHALTSEESAQIASHMIPVPGRWLKGRTTTHEPPTSWAERSFVARTVLLPMRRTSDGRWTCDVGSHLLEISDVGLEKK
ncbi:MULTISPECIES: CRISPR-associated helicase Cas3' [unclassified Nocardiopsis]|uniref:CRISPR-associated helicase Cas3' n=1 Tax=Nocardiopsis TaxID=2013 RepID=UPI00387B235D